MKIHTKLFLLFIFLCLTAMGCQLLAPPAIETPTMPLPTNTPTSTPTPLPAIAVKPSSENPDEPVFISGSIPYSSPFFANSSSEPFVMLEDQAGFVQRDRDFEFRLESQVIGPVEDLEEGRLSYYLSLPAVPQGTFVDVDQDDDEDTGVQVFAIAYWSNTWGDPFLETRDGTGWSNAYASTITDPANDNEITGGTLIVWAPDDQQAFPSGFGLDGLLFTADDPTQPIPAGYNIVDLEEEPFSLSKEARVQLDLFEGVIATNDYSEMSYEDAFISLFDKVAREYPFTEEKGINWAELEDNFIPRAENANDEDEFFRVLWDFSNSFPDGHANVSFNANVFYEDYGEGFGLLTTELSDGRFIASEVLDGFAAESAGIQKGAEIISWDGLPTGEAVEGVVPGFGPYSTAHTLRVAQAGFLTRVPARTRIEVSFKNPGSQSIQTKTMNSDSEYDSVFLLLPAFQEDPLALPIEGHVLQDSGIGYLRISTFSDDYQLMARLWEHYLYSMQEEEIEGLIIDLRQNGGGSMGLALDFAGFFFDEEFELYTGSYFNEKSGEFEASDHAVTVHPAPLLYEGMVAILIGPECVSACEGFAYAMSMDQRSILVGHYPTAGAFGEVGRGQYKLPDDISMQFPTSRPLDTDGNLLIEGTGVQPDILVPVTEESILEDFDAVLEAAVKALLD